MIVPRSGTVRIPIRRFREGAGRSVRDLVTVEEPLEIRVTWQEAEAVRTRSLSVTMRTPGDDFALAAGFLFAEGLVRAPRDIRKISFCSGPDRQEYNRLEIRLAPSAGFDPAGLERHFYMTSSCGVCGKASIDAIEVRAASPLPPDGLRIEAARLQAIPEGLRAAQTVFGKTGGIHAAGLFDEAGGLIEAREDVGRHNAVDKVIGDRFLAGALPLAGSVLALSGRASFELVQKAVMAGVPVLAAVGAPSSLAVELARRFDLTLVGFLTAEGFNVYTGGHRIV